MTLSAGFLGYGAGALALLVLAGDFGWRIWQQVSFEKDVEDKDLAETVDRATLRDSRIATGLRVAFIISLLAGCASLGATIMASNNEEAMKTRVTVLETNLGGVDRRVTALENNPPNGGDALLKEVQALRLDIDNLKPTVRSLVTHVSKVDKRLSAIETRLKLLERQQTLPDN